MDTSLHILKDQRIHTDKFNVMEANQSDAFSFPRYQMALVCSKFNQTHCNVMFCPWLWQFTAVQGGRKSALQENVGRKSLKVNRVTWWL